MGSERETKATTLAPLPGGREPYEPPLVDRIRLVRDEMAVAGCKATRLGVAVARACRVSICRDIGS
jgi:hypothetical protein